MPGPLRSAAPAILVINPGSTSTKIALFTGRRKRFEAEISHQRRSLAKFSDVCDQGPYRLRAIRRQLSACGIDGRKLDIFMGRGGLLRPVEAGVYEVNDRMLDDLRTCRYGEHASNLGAILAYDLARQAGGRAWIADPVVVDELSDVARISGHPDMPRRSVFHALSQKAAARKMARKLAKDYRQCNLIVAHIGGGVSIGAHRGGRVVDVNNALDGEGPMSPERTGGLAVLDFHRYACDRNLSISQAAMLVTRQGGLWAHLGTNDCKLIEKRARTDRRYRLVYEAFIYQVAKSISALQAAFEGENVDAVVLTGSVVKGRMFARKLGRLIAHVSPVCAKIPLMENESLASNAMDAFKGSIRMMEY